MATSEQLLYDKIVGITPHIRKATTEDASRIAEILIFSKRLNYRSIFCDDKTSFGEMQVLPLATEYMNKPDKLDGVFVYDDEFVKAMMTLSVTEGTDGTTVEIGELYVDTFFVGEGIGGRMISAVTDLLCGVADSVTLWVLEKNEKARRFYEKHGFSHDGARRQEQGTDEFVVRYTKTFK